VSEERIDGSELEYLRAVMQQAQAAQMVAQSYQAYLAQKYKLQGADALRMDGVIVRAEQEKTT
jgi:hypothetical protein